jgi:diguanylate cyclase (GGDEF)-like protein
MSTAEAGSGDLPVNDLDDVDIIAPRSGDHGQRSLPKPRCGSCGQVISDAPTGLLERTHWDDQAVRAVARARNRGSSIALIMIDLDRFKDVNDHYGHIAGDAILRGTADVIRESSRDGVACRYGGSAGDEFLVLLPDTTLEEALEVAERVRAGITGMSVTAKVTRTLSATIEGQTASIGVATYCAGDLAELDVEDLMLDADVALRAAKRHGRDRICIANLDVTTDQEAALRANQRQANWSTYRRLRSV